MDVSVILCTYNRCESLGRALDSVLASELPASVEWEVLVVDNNSQDATCEVARSYSQRYPDRVRYLFEPQAGKSHALNASIARAAGDIFAFMDDDVTVEPKWLDELTKALRNGDWAGSGGRILPDWTREPPRWLLCEGRYALAPLAIFDLGTTASELREPPFGTSMAFRRAVFERHGGFRTDLGPQPGNQIRSEDTEFGRRVLSAGERLWYAPSAVVYHPVADERLTKRYFLDWWFDKGRAEIRELGTAAPGSRVVNGVPLRFLPTLVKQLLLWAFAFSPRRRFARKALVWQKAGQIVESRRRASPSTATPSVRSVGAIF